MITVWRPEAFPMPKLLRAVRLEDSDEHLFKTHGAALEGEWVVSGGYALCDFANAPKCDPRCLLSPVYVQKISDGQPGLFVLREHL